MENTDKMQNKRAIPGNKSREGTECARGAAQETPNLGGLRLAPGVTCSGKAAGDASVPVSPNTASLFPSETRRGNGLLSLFII